MLHIIVRICLCSILQRSHAFQNTLGPTSPLIGQDASFSNGCSYAKAHLSRRNSCLLWVFRSSNVEEPLVSWKVPKNAAKNLLESSTALPWQLELESSHLNSRLENAGPVLTVRTLQDLDIKAIVEMCLREYGSTPAPGALSSLFQNPRLLVDWCDREWLRLLVDVTSRLKVQPVLPKDHAILVSSLDDKIIGMIEVSQQPVLRDRNPPPFPIPLWLKLVYSFVTRSRLQGWITNLLIVPEYRGRGCSKVLVAACEAIAFSSWQCSSIHLHCDADPESGRISQALYLGMDYEALPSDPIYSWMMEGSSPTAAATNSVFMVQGVPLLYLQKTLPRV